MVTLTKNRNQFTFDANEVENKVIRKALTFNDPKAKSRSIYGNGGGYNKVTICRKNSFDQGFIYRVRKALDAANIEHTTLGEAKYPTNHLVIPDMFSPEERAYQHQAMFGWMSIRNGIIRASTRSGKTAIFGHIAKALIEEQPNIKIAFLTESKSIFSQNKKEIAGFIGQPIGEIAGTKRVIKTVTCVMAQTVDSAFRKVKDARGRDTAFNLYPQKASEMSQLLSQFDMVCVDECHLFLSTKRRAAIKLFSSARYMLGLSATPFKESDPIGSWKMQGILGGEVFQIGEKILRENSILTTDKIIFIKAPPAKKTYDYQTCVDKNIIESKYRLDATLKIVEVCRELELKLLIFVDRIRHGELYAKAIGCDFVAGNADDDTRERLKKKFLDMRGGVMIASSIFVAGVSFTEVDCTLALAGGLEETRQQQRRGRALGVGSRDRSITFDFHDLEEKYLLKHSIARRRAYEKQSEGIKAKLIDLTKPNSKAQLKKFMIEWFKLSQEKK